MISAGDVDIGIIYKHCRDDDFLTRFAPRHHPCDSGETPPRGEDVVVYSRKIYDYNSKESPPSIKVTRNLLVCESLGKGTCCARGRSITPSAPYLRQAALLFDCFFLSLIFFCFLKFDVDLSS